MHQTGCQPSGYGVTPLSPERAVLEPRNEPAVAARSAPRARPATAAHRQEQPPVKTLAAACPQAGLTARFDIHPTAKASMIAPSAAVHSIIDALVRAALERHRPHAPARRRRGSRPDRNCVTTPGTSTYLRQLRRVPLAPRRRTRQSCSLPVPPYRFRVAGGTHWSSECRAHAGGPNPPPLTTARTRRCVRVVHDSGGVLIRRGRSDTAAVHRAPPHPSGRSRPSQLTRAQIG